MKKTVKVRVALVVNSNGNWNAYGSQWCEDKGPEEAMSFALEGLDEPGHETRFYLTAEVEVPETDEVEATVSQVSDS